MLMQKKKHKKTEEIERERKEIALEKSIGSRKNRFFIIKCNNKLVLEALNRALKRDFEALF